jgi:hypothetical protein
MITNNLLNKGGRLGNQMFQYANLLGVKYKLGYDIHLTKNQIDTSMLVESFDLKECVLLDVEEIYNNETYLENCHCFDPNVFKVDDNTNLRGYFQTEKYFSHCADVVKKEFTFKESIVSNCEILLKELKNKNLVSIHVRRTDYLSLTHIHGKFNLDYYKQAIDLFTEPNTFFVVVSDDINWCKNNFQYENFIFSNGDTNFDLCLQSKCNHHIISNSTFSWWGAWLGENKNKKVVAPKKWFSDSFEYSYVDIVPYNWIKI